MKSNGIVFALALIVLPVTGSYGFMCPSTFNQVQIGDTISQIEQQCGKADIVTKADLPNNQPQQWDYYLQPSSTSNNMFTQSETTGTLKTTFAFDAAGKLVNITVNGTGVGTSSGCGSPVSIGDTRQSVEAACGKPSFINSQTPAPAPAGADDKDANKQIEWTYNSNPPVTLIFREGKLVEKK